MKTLKPFLVCLLGTLALAACDPIEGTLQVLQPFTAVSGDSSQPCNFNQYDYPCMNPTENITVEPGSYRMSLDMRGRGLAQLRLDVGRSQKVLELQVPRGKGIPDNGQVVLTSQESGQPFDLIADTVTNISNSETQQGRESCQVPVYEQVCRLEGQPARERCQTEVRYQTGSQDVTFYYQTKTQNMTAQIQVSGSTVAQLNGSRSNTQKIYTYQSSCYLIPEPGYGHGGGWPRPRPRFP